MRLCLVIMLFTTIIVMNGHAADAIRIGVIINNSGVAGKFDRIHIKSLDLAANLLNEKGGIKGQHVELVPFYSNTTSLGAKAAAIAAVDGDVVAVIGPSWSSHAVAAATVLQKAKIPMVTPLASNPKVTGVGDYIFRVCFTDVFQSKALAQFALKDLSADNIVILANPDNIYSENLSKEFSRWFIQQGGHVSAKMDYVDGVTDYRQLAGMLMKLNPKVVFLPGYPKDSSTIINEARNIGVESIFLGADGWGDTMLKYSGDKLGENYFSGNWHPDLESSESRLFVKEYKKQVGDFSSRGSALFYDAFNVIAKAIETADEVTHKSVRDSLYGVKSFKGVTGDIAFDRHGNVKKPIVIMKFLDGKTQYLKTIQP